MFPIIINDLGLHNTSNQGNIYIETCRTILCINICKLFHEGERGYKVISILFIKFHHYSSFCTAFDIASNRQYMLSIEVYP